MEIKKLEKSRISEIFPILNQFLNTIGEDELLDESKLKITNAVETEKISFFVAINEENQIVGMCSLSYAFTTFGGGGTLGIFEDFFITQLSRKQGLARKMVAAVFEDAKLKKSSSVIVTCDEEDFEMYKNLGFSLGIGQTLSKVFN